MGWTSAQCVLWEAVERGAMRCGAERCGAQRLLLGGAAWERTELRLRHCESSPCRDRTERPRDSRAADLRGTELPALPVSGF